MSRKSVLCCVRKKQKGIHSWEGFVVGTSSSISIKILKLGTKGQCGSAG